MAGRGRIRSLAGRRAGWRPQHVSRSSRCGGLHPGRRVGGVGCCCLGCLVWWGLLTCLRRGPGRAAAGCRVPRSRVAVATVAGAVWLLAGCRCRLEVSDGRTGVVGSGRGWQVCRRVSAPSLLPGAGRLLAGLIVLLALQVVRRGWEVFRLARLCLGGGCRWGDRLMGAVELAGWGGSWLARASGVGWGGLRRARGRRRRVMDVR